MEPAAVVETVDHVDLVVVPRAPALAPDAWATLVSSLPAVERHRLGAVHRNDGQQDSAVGWSLLTALGARHGVSVRRDAVGRPVADPPVDLSLSHGGGWIAVAASRHGRVGVDVEAAREVSPALAQRCLAPAELHWLELADGPGDRAHRFARLWTAKEAYLKAIGTGLGVDPRSFTVDCSAPRPRLVADRQDRWLFHSSARAQAAWVTVCQERAGR